MKANCLIQVNISLMNWLNFELLRTGHAQLANNHARVQKCLSGGGGGVREWSSSALTAVFFSPQLISMLYKGFRWGPTFPGGGGGVQMLLFIETTYIT